MTVRNSDNLDRERGLPSLADASVDAIVTDPPAGISFMGRDWDGDKGGRAAWIAWMTSVMAECLRVLKPGGHALVWALPRTSHWTATAIEDAGFEVRDIVMHLFGTGFPKSLDISKAIDAYKSGANQKQQPPNRQNVEVAYTSGSERSTFNRYAGAALVSEPTTDEAMQWKGWGTALKPAAEHWILARKPLEGTYAENVLAHGTGALNIDACRIDCEPRPNIEMDRGRFTGTTYHGGLTGAFSGSRSNGLTTEGRWPANVVLDEEAAAVLDEQAGERKSGKKEGGKYRGFTTEHLAGKRTDSTVCYADSGGASRFFYVAKASTSEKTAGGTIENKHPTVKSIALMRWLCRLVTPPGGLVVDPFAGSGTTGIACKLEGFQFLGFEQEPEHAATARARIEAA